MIVSGLVSLLRIARMMRLRASVESLSVINNSCFAVYIGIQGQRLSNCPFTELSAQNYHTLLFSLAPRTYMIILRENDIYEALQFQNNCAAF